MREITELDSGMRIGASATLVEMEEALRIQIAIKPGNLSKIINIIIVTN